MSSEKPEVKIEDGNAFHIIGKVKNALQRAGLHEQARRYEEEATQSDYDHLLRVTMNYVEIQLED